ncbi:hypothetical protein Klosneuvirus_3_248 [Klosneuvirus KNV1]|uniref:Uncharacterized protein n=1 Tax=Klosneuvirus KNV1 TaxID=1977640 RepID=A0A1V0SK79_9VIRU|nr:hypothetical protein Klosneuvirus_3_248 [Klosneuvirus KNV1]
MKYIITSYTYSGKLSNLTEHFDEIKQLELSNDLCCIHHQSEHKCNYPLHKADKKFFGFHNTVTIIMKYLSDNIRIKLFKSGSVILHYKHKTEIPVNNIIEKLKGKLTFNTVLSKYKLRMKVVEWRTSGNNLKEIKSYLQLNYNGNYDIVENNLSPIILFDVHGNKICMGRKSIISTQRHIENKETDNFILVLQKYFNSQNNEFDDNNNAQDNENKDDDIENEADEDKQMTITI